MLAAFLFTLGLMLSLFMAARVAVLVREWPLGRLALLASFLWLMVGLALVFIALAEMGVLRG